MNDKIVTLCYLIYELTYKYDVCTQPAHYLVRKQVNSTIHIRRSKYPGSKISVEICANCIKIMIKTKGSQVIEVESKFYDFDILRVPLISTKELYSICKSVYTELQERIYI